MSTNKTNPYLSHSQATEIIKRLYGLTVSVIQPLPSYIDQNFYVATTEGEEFLLKVINSADSQNSTIIELQTHTMTFLHQRGFPAQTVLPTLTGQLMSLQELGINHGDLNDRNLLVKPDGSSKYKISGILDFAHMSSGYFIFELAIIIRYMMVGSPNPVDVGGPVLAGWESVFPLNEAEKDSLYLLVLCRFCQSLVIGRQTVIQQPENEEYVMIASKSRRDHFCRLWELGKEEVERIWFQSAAQFSQP